jgi:hypothetical protein
MSHIKSLDAIKSVGGILHYLMRYSRTLGMVDTGWCQLNFIKPTNNAFHDDLEERWWDL